MAFAKKRKKERKSSTYDYYATTGRRYNSYLVLFSNSFVYELTIYLSVCMYTESVSIDSSIHYASSDLNCNFDDLLTSSFTYSRSLMYVNMCFLIVYLIILCVCA